jgi:hypothetical protein
LQVIFAVLSEENTLEESSVTSNLGLSDIAEGGITLGSEIVDFLANRPATLLQFADHYRILTLHPPSNQENVSILKYTLLDLHRYLVTLKHCTWNMKSLISEKKKFKIKVAHNLAYKKVFIILVNG